MRSRTQNSTRNIITGFANKMILLILSFVSRKIFITYIGLEYLGINSLFANLLQMLSLADLGFGVAMAYSYYEPLAKKDEKKIAGLITFYRNVYNWIAIIVAIIGLLLIPFLKYIVNMNQDIPHLYLIYVISLLNVVISYLFVYKASIINADQNAFLINKVSIYVNVIKILCQCICIAILKNYFAYIIFEVIATIANNLVISNKAEKLYPYIMNKEKLAYQEKKDIIGNIRSVFIYKVSATIMGSTDNIIMSKISGIIIVGCYSNYLIIVNQLTAFVQIIFSSLTASVGNLLIENESKKNYEVFKIMQMFSNWISAIATGGVLILIQDFISLWLGTEYLMSTSMVWAIAINLYFTISMQPIWSYREASGLYQKTKYVMLLTAVLNIILSIIWGLHIGPEGIIIATVVSRAVTYFWYEPTLIHRSYFKRKVAPYYIDYIVNIFIIVGVYSVMDYLPLNEFDASWLLLLVKTVIMVCIISMICFLRYFWTDEFKVCWSKLKNYITK